MIQNRRIENFLNVEKSNIYFWVAQNYKKFFSSVFNLTHRIPRILTPNDPCISECCIDIKLKFLIFALLWSAVFSSSGIGTGIVILYTNYIQILIWDLQWELLCWHRLTNKKINPKEEFNKVHILVSNYTPSLDNFSIYTDVKNGSIENIPIKKHWVSLTT